MKAVRIEQPKHVRRGVILGVAALIVVAIAAATAWKLWLTKPATMAMSPALRATTEDRSIAVLPFVNMSSDKEQEYFSDGLSEELLNQLAQIKDCAWRGERQLLVQRKE